MAGVRSTWTWFRMGPFSISVGEPGRASQRRNVMKRLLCVLALVATASCGGKNNQTYAVRRTLRDVGGPAPGADTGTSGTVRALTEGGELVAAVTTQSDGSFVLRVPKGTYVFKGGGPQGPRTETSMEMCASGRRSACHRPRRETSSSRAVSPDSGFGVSGF